MSYPFVPPRAWSTGSCNIPGVEIVSRDRCGLYAQAARRGAPQAKLVADRFHLLQNLREAIERQMSRVSQFAGRSLLSPGSDSEREAARQGHRESRQALFPPCPGVACCWNAQSRRSKARPELARIRCSHGSVPTTLPVRRPTSPTTKTPAYFRDFLLEQWEAGNRRGRHLFHDLRHRGYTGSYSYLQRFLAEWRRGDYKDSAKGPAPQEPKAPARRAKRLTQ